MLWPRSSMENLICLVQPDSKRHEGQTGDRLRKNMMSRAKAELVLSPVQFYNSFFFNVGVKAGVQNKQWLPLMMSSQSVEFGRLKMWSQFVRRKVQSSFTQSVNWVGRGWGGYEGTGRMSTLNNLRLNYARAKTQEYTIFFICPRWNNRGFGQMSETRRQENNQMRRKVKTAGRFGRFGRAWDKWQIKSVFMDENQPSWGHTS